MKTLFSLFFIVVCLTIVAYAAPVDNKNTPDQSKSAFGPAFDEIVVESSLTVKRKVGNERDGRSQSENKRVKRQFQGRRKNPNRQQLQNNNNFPAQNFGQLPKFPSAAAAQAGAQAQDFQSNGPLGSFGASATGTQTQTLALNKGGIAGSGAFGMTQQYRLPNGQVIDFTINNSFGGTNGAFAKGGGSSLNISGPQPVAVGK